MYVGSGVLATILLVVSHSLGDAESVIASTSIDNHKLKVSGCPKSGHQ